MATPAGSPPKSRGLAPTTLSSVLMRAARQPQRPRLQHNGSVTAVAISDDNKYVTTASHVNVD